MREVGAALALPGVRRSVSGNRSGGSWCWAAGKLARLVLSLACLLAVLGAGAPSSEAASAMLWSAPQLIDPANPTPSIDDSLGLNAVSCASSSLCAAVEGAGSILTSTDPLEDPGSWGTAYTNSGDFLDAVSCPSTLLCVALTSSGTVVTSTDPTDESSTWTASTIQSQAGSNAAYNVISCAPNTSTCVAGGFNGLATTIGSGWQAFSFPGLLTITGISCPSASLCVATFSDGQPVSGNPSGVITSTDPNGGQSDWTVTYLPVDGLVGVSCPTVSLCVADSNVFDTGIVTSTNPTGGAGAWSAVNANPFGEPVGMSCASPTLCVVLGGEEGRNGGQEAYASTNPTAGPSAWNVSSIEPSSVTTYNQYVISVSCLLGTSTCVAVDRKNVYLANAVPANALTVAVAGTGTGQVSGNPGIICPAVPIEECSNMLPAGSTITLDETAFVDQFFAGWSSPCAKTTATVCSVTMSDNETVTATFDHDQPHCSIEPRHSTVLLKRPRMRSRVSIDTLPLTVTCDQDVRLVLNATITATLHRRTKYRKARTKRITIPPVRVTVKSAVAKKFTLKLPSVALAYLRRHKHEMMLIAMDARGAHGSKRSSTTLPALQSGGA